MTIEERRILILAGRLSRLDARWPLAPWLDRLERRGFLPQVLCTARGRVLADDPRCFECPPLGQRWLRGWAARAVWSLEGLRRPELIHVVHDEMSEAALVLAEVAKLPYVQAVADFRTLGRGLRLSRRWCCKLVAIGSGLAQGLIEDLGVPASRVVVIPPGIALPEEPVRELPLDRLPVIGAGGPMDEVSGLLVFLEAARLILDAGRDAEFVIAGHWDSQVELRRRAQVLGIADRVTVADFPSDGADYWAVLDLYCQPATQANAGVTLLQAMAHAVPCIATSAAGLRGLVQSGSTGLTIPPGDPQALAQAIADLLSRPEDARQMGRAARRRVQDQFDPEHEADRIVELYREVLSNGTINADDANDSS